MIREWLVTLYASPTEAGIFGGQERGVGHHAGIDGAQRIVALADDGHPVPAKLLDQAGIVVRSRSPKSQLGRITVSRSRPESAMSQSSRSHSTLLRV